MPRKQHTLREEGQYERRQRLNKSKKGRKKLRESGRESAGTWDKVTFARWDGLVPGGKVAQEVLAFWPARGFQVPLGVPESPWERVDREASCQATGSLGVISLCSEQVQNFVPPMVLITSTLPCNFKFSEWPPGNFQIVLWKGWYAPSYFT